MVPTDTIAAEATARRVNPPLIKTCEHRFPPLIKENLQIIIEPCYFYSNICIYTNSNNAGSNIITSYIGCRQKHEK